MYKRQLSASMVIVICRAADFLLEYEELLIIVSYSWRIRAFEQIVTKGGLFKKYPCRLCLMSATKAGFSYYSECTKHISNATLDATSASV